MKVKPAKAVKLGSGKKLPETIPTKAPRMMADEAMIKAGHIATAIGEEHLPGRPQKQIPLSASPAAKLEDSNSDAGLDLRNFKRKKV